MTLVTFIIPVRHQDNARNWSVLKANLAQTIASISNQTSDDWRGIIVANEGADLPLLPDRFSVVRVSFPPNDIHERGGASGEDFLDAFRVDKGRRVLAGMLRARDSRFFMIVDDDDFVSNRIVQHVSTNADANGWRIDKGYLWDDGGRLLLQHDDFNHVCGTSLIIRSTLYGLPERFEAASLDWIKSMLGSHVRIADILAERGAPLATLPFRGAVYRVANEASHSKTPSLLIKYFLNRAALSHPRQLVRNARKLRLVSPVSRREFFGGTARSPRQVGGQRDRWGEGTLVACSADRLHVLAWPAFSNRRSNPYQAELYSAIAVNNCVRDAYFGPSGLAKMLMRRCDIFHLHWIERILWERQQWKVPGRMLIFALTMVALRLKGARVVWTVHDPEPHNMEENERASRGLLRALWPWYMAIVLRSIDGLIFLSPSHMAPLFRRFPRLASLPHAVIRHPHYRGVYERNISREEARRRLGLGAEKFAIVSVGKLRPYKNVEGLITAFRAFPDEDSALVIAGEPDSEAYGEELRRLAEHDCRVRLILDFVPDADLQLYLQTADVVVIPFKKATNSGSVMLVLSFDRPVAVPDVPVFRELQEIVGPAWLYLFGGPLDSAEFARIRKWANDTQRESSAPLETLDWASAASQTIAFYDALRRGDEVLEMRRSEARL